jgi:hypothetical protein
VSYTLPAHIREKGMAAGHAATGKAKHGWMMMIEASPLKRPTEAASVPVLKLEVWSRAPGHGRLHGAVGVLSLDGARRSGLPLLNGGC